MLTQDVQRVALSVMEALDCPRSLTVAILLRYSEWEQLARIEVDPEHHITPESYFRAAQASAFLKKHEDLQGDGLDPEAAAYHNWYHCESECFRTNRRLYRIINGFATDERLLAFISKVREKIRKILGASPDDDLVSRFGPGATVSDSSRFATIPDKMSSQPTCTPGATAILPVYARCAWGRAVSARGGEISVVRGNHFFTVPKDATKHRSCAKEPSLNGAYQLALGRVIRRRLSKAGLDLVNGQETHRQVACKSSIDGGFCTIDLSSASDCMSEGLVRLLLPHDWFTALNQLRSHFTFVKKKWVKLEKFSSMGNGFTFELETMIFAAIASTAAEDGIFGVDVFVYGDDIICRSEHSFAVLSALKYFGFTPNQRKTFVQGSFRESCGGDFFGGRDVRPYYLKKDLHDPQDYISLANGIRRFTSKIQDDRVLKGLRRVWFGVLDSIPRLIRNCRGPEELGDLVIHDEVSRWDTRVRDSIRYVRCWRPAKYRKVFLARFHPDVQLASILYGVYLQGPGANDELRFVVPRDGVISYKRGWIPFS